MSQPDTAAVGREELRALYSISVDEYRFQVNLNWQRSQYYMAFNAAIVAAGAGLLQATKGETLIVVAVVFLVGFSSCVLAVLAGEAQHDYYRAARDGKRRLEDRLALGELAIRTTGGMTGLPARFGKVRSFNRALLVAVMVANLAGIGVALHRFITGAG